ncbi:conserved hypothetical protein [Hyphomicrobiales bacterium]|jgi:hypothetical protein|nr:conserved hypothetical protein [Hyphomicrobiales bacterium]CAH1702267.1 hypothetical protein BOSEA1005_30139 [Hyphomicrobiales bacterium]CAI0346470.1 conserved hypothetical protein [Hyphomicrobiales bacterium]
MTNSNWPSFETADLGDSEADEVEFTRRWEAYRDGMQALIDSGTVHRDQDDWWVDTATGTLIGPDPELVRARSAEELSSFGP